jgi:YHS domain-containing protein
MKKLIIYALALLFTTVSAYAQKKEIFSTDGRAIRGYDVVAFFKDSTAVKGSENFSYQWKETTWLFANEENKNAFIANPSMYEPQYGGYCAYGAASGYKAPTETNTWTLLNGKLYFNYNNKVKGLWNKDQPALIQKANDQWIIIKDKE